MYNSETIVTEKHSIVVYSNNTYNQTLMALENKISQWYKKIISNSSSSSLILTVATAGVVGDTHTVVL